MASGTIQGSKTGSYGVRIEWTSTPDVETNTSKFVMKTYVSHPKINISSRTGSTTIDGSTASYNTSARFQRQHNFLLCPSMPRRVLIKSTRTSVTGAISARPATSTTR